MNLLPTCTDKQLLQRCCAGDKKGWEELIDRFSDPVYRTIQFTLRRRNLDYTRRDLEDYHNTVFLSLFENHCRKLRQYKGLNGCSVQSWIKLLTIRIIVDRLRKEAKDADARGIGKRRFEEVPELVGAFEDPLSMLQREERFRLLQVGIENLQPRDRLFLKLHFWANLPIGKVANILDINENAAYSVKHRALKRLRAQIGRILDQAD